MGEIALPPSRLYRLARNEGCDLLTRLLTGSHLWGTLDNCQTRLILRAKPCCPFLQTNSFTTSEWPSKVSTSVCVSLLAYISSVVSLLWGKLRMPSPKGKFLALQTGYVVEMSLLGWELVELMSHVLIVLSREHVTISSREERDQSMP